MSTAQAAMLEQMESATRYNQWLFDRCRPFLGRRVLDAGAGTGTFTAMLATAAEVVFAAEPDPAFVQILERRFGGQRNVKILTAEAAGLDRSDLEAPLDSIVCLNVLEHIADDEQALRRFRSLLEPGGHLLVLVPSHPFLFGSLDEALGHERRYRKRDLEDRSARAGFAPTVLRYVNPTGGFGWLTASRVRRRHTLASRSLGLYDRLVPLLRTLDRVPLPFGLSLWMVAQAR